MSDDGVVLRPAGPDDVAAVVDLCGGALGWAADDRNVALFRWKHQANPFGPSPTWVAETGGRLVGVRTFLRWGFDSPHGPVDAVRAVDTATAPDHQGRGLFSRLTLDALPALRAEGIGFVFNTPNARSRPGYRKMGWQVVGRVPVALGVVDAGSVVRLPQARVAAGKWSQPCPAGAPAGEVLADDDGLARLLAAAGPSPGLATRRTPAFLRWRYAEGPVTYRALTLDGVLGDGLALFRLRRRGRSVEVVVADVVVPAGSDAGARRRALLRGLARDAGGDHLLAVATAPVSLPLLRVPGLGPVLTWRALGCQEMPPMRRWDLRLGDIELF